MRYCVRFRLAVAAAALLTAAAGASPVTYNFSASTEYVVFSITGTFVAEGNSLRSWSFDFSDFAGKRNLDGLVLQPFDNGGSYLLDNYDSNYSVSNGYDYEFSATGGNSFSHLFL